MQAVKALWHIGCDVIGFSIWLAVCAAGPGGSSLDWPIFRRWRKIVAAQQRNLSAHVVRRGVWKARVVFLPTTERRHVRSALPRAHAIGSPRSGSGANPGDASVPTPEVWADTLRRIRGREAASSSASRDCDGRSFITDK